MFNRRKQIGFKVTRGKHSGTLLTGEGEGERYRHAKDGFSGVSPQQGGH